MILAACLQEIRLAPHADEREGANEGSRNKYRQMVRLRAFHLMALFILVYVGTEVTLGGGYIQFTELTEDWLIYAPRLCGLFQGGSSRT